MRFVSRVGFAIAVMDGIITGGELAAAMSPFGFLIHGMVGNGAQRTDEAAVRADEHAGKSCAGRFVHERHELVGKTRHGAADANATDVRAAADAVHPSAF